MLPAPLPTVTSAFVAAAALLASHPAHAGDGTPAKTVPAVPTMQKAAPGNAAAAAPLPSTVDPKAKAIHDRAIDVLKKLKGIDMVTDLKLNGIDPSMLPPGVGGKTHVVLDFTNPIEGPAPFGRFALETLKDGKPVARFAFDGKAAILVDEAAKSYESTDAQWFQLLGQRAAALPQWHIENRMDLAALGASADDLPKLVGLAVVGEETVDGTPCDVLKAVRSAKIGGMEDDEGKPMPAKELRIVETLAIARADGLPRRVASITEMPGEDAMAGMDTVTTFTAVKVDPALDAGAFSTKAPDGYKKADRPKDDGAGAPPEPELKVKAGDAAPPFSLKDLDGKEVSLKSLAGKVVLLDFWATWCGPCKAAMPSIQKIHEDYKDKGVMVFGVNTWERKEGAAKKYIAEKGYTYPCLLGGDDLASGSYGTSGIPTLVVIGKDGKVAMIEVGFGGDKKIRAAIDAALAK